MINASAVIGSSFGDEGKGQTVNSLSTEKTCVVRFNGGAQAGHTVVYNGNRHVFHQLGCGTMKGASTFLSREHIVNPAVYFDERDKFPNTCVYVDAKCRLTTLTDMVVNQLIEEDRDKTRHGSCGLGINETVLRNINMTPLCFRDLVPSNRADFLTKIEHIWCEDGPNRLHQLNCGHLVDAYFKILTKGIVDVYILMATQMYDDVRMVESLDELVGAYSHFVFEGAQGLLLSETNTEFFPHLTRSDTGVSNVIQLLSELHESDRPECINTRYITRPYLTRHGAGPLPFELESKPLKTIEDETNIPNAWQGSLRFAPLNFDLLQKYIMQDYSKCIMPAQGHIHITCWDQVVHEKVSFVHNGILHTNKTADVLLGVMNEVFPLMEIHTSTLRET